MDSRKRCLGMDRAISRRDLLNGVSVAIGASLLPACANTGEPIVEGPSAYYPRPRPGCTVPIRVRSKWFTPRCGGSFAILIRFANRSAPGHHSSKLRTVIAGNLPRHNKTIDLIIPRNAARQGRHRKRDGPDRPADHRTHWHPTCVQISKSGQCLCAPGARHRVPCRRDAT